MKIVFLSPPWIPLSPKGYGRIERIVYYLKCRRCILTYSHAIYSKKAIAKF